MSNLDEQIKINRLLDIYGRLLTDAQQEIMNDYFNLNLSLSEISENRNISRTAVSDAIKTSRQKLENYEENLGICRVIDLVSSKSDKDKEVASDIEEKIKNGI